ncbi:hypothetical protein BDW68DRAFT_177020 [Aspergillus falconensis]
MHFTTVFTVSALSALSVLSTAAPSADQPRQAVNTIYLGLYSNPGCTSTAGGDVDHIHLIGSGYYNCFASTEKQSIVVAQNQSAACAIQVWTESNCSGSGVLVSNNGCHDTTYASVSASC